MEISMSQAALSAALSVLLGIFLGAIYDVIRFLRVVFGVTVASPFKRGNHSPRAVLGYVFVILGDLLFFIVCAVLMSVFFFLTGDGRMRGYALVGAFLGFLLYYNTVGRLFIGAVTRIKALLKKLLKFAFRPVVKFFKFLKKICSRIFELPIVKGTRTRYNNYIDKRKKQAAARARRKKAKSGGYCTNGGAHG